MSHGFLAFSYALFAAFVATLALKLKSLFNLGYTAKPSC